MSYPVATVPVEAVGPVDAGDRAHEVLGKPPERVFHRSHRRTPSVFFNDKEPGITLFAETITHRFSGGSSNYIFCTREISHPRIFERHWR
jgi:hypothetical protein